MSDDKPLRQSGLSSPFQAGEAIDLSGGDATPASPGRGFYVGSSGGGIVSFRTVGGSDVDIDAAGGSYHPWRVSMFYQAGTTATGIVIGR